MLNKIIGFLTNTIAEIELPYVNKKFNLKDYFKIEQMLSELKVPFAVVLVTTNGNIGSNFLIRTVNKLSPLKIKRKSNITHAIAYVDLIDGLRHRTVESISEGLVEQRLLTSIGQRDEVIIMKPVDTVLNEQVCKYVLEYIHSKVREDRKENIEYDFDHDILDPEKMDCSELIFNALAYGYKKADQMMPLMPVERGMLGMKKLTFTPVDLQHSPLFEVMYDSKVGL